MLQLFLTFPIRPSRSWRSICSNRSPRSVWNCTNKKSYSISPNESRLIFEFYFAKYSKCYLNILQCHIPTSDVDSESPLPLLASLSILQVFIQPAIPHLPPPLERRFRHAQQKNIKFMPKGNCRPSLPAEGRDTLLLINDSFAADICLFCTAFRLHFIPCDDDMGSCNKM